MLIKFPITFCVLDGIKSHTLKEKFEESDFPPSVPEFPLVVAADGALVAVVPAFEVSPPRTVVACVFLVADGCTTTKEVLSELEACEATVLCAPAPAVDSPDDKTTPVSEATAPPAV